MKMKRLFMTLAAVTCCAMISSVFTACGSDDDKDSDLPANSPQRLANNPVWKRMIVISAGVITNIITAFLLVFFVAAVWGQLPSNKAEIYIDEIVAEIGESVWDSGMKNGDRILKINGKEVFNTKK